MTASLYRRLIRPEALNTLGALFPDQYGASTLLVPLGADMARLPPFGTLPPAQWWFGALTTIDHGAFDFGLEDLMEAVLTWFPGAQVLAQLSTGATTTPASKPPHVLCLLASPSDQAQLSLAEEQRLISLIARPDRLTVTVHTATRTTDLAPAMLAARPDVVHFAGHGDSKGRLIFHNELSLSAPVSAQALGALFESVGELACCVLNSCYSGGYAKTLLGSARTVVGSADLLYDEEALAFARGFYEALATGRTPLEAYLVGVAEMELAGLPTGKMRYVDREGRSMHGGSSVETESAGGGAA